MQHIELLQIVKRSWFKLTLAAICSAVVAGMTAYSAYLVKPVVEDIFELKDAERLMLIPLLVMAVAFKLFFALVMLMRARVEVLERERNSQWVRELVESS